MHRLMHRRKRHLGTAGMQEARLGDTDGGRQAAAGEKGFRGKAQNVSEGKKLDGYGRAAGATPVKTPPISFPREELVRVSQSEGSKYAASFPPTESETIERGCWFCFCIECVAENWHLPRRLWGEFVSSQSRFLAVAVPGRNVRWRGRACATSIEQCFFLQVLRPHLPHQTMVSKPLQFLD